MNYGKPFLPYICMLYGLFTHFLYKSYRVEHLLTMHVLHPGERAKRSQVNMQALSLAACLPIWTMVSSCFMSLVFLLFVLFKLMAEGKRKPGQIVVFDGNRPDQEIDEQGGHEPRHAVHSIRLNLSHIAANSLRKGA